MTSSEQLTKVLRQLAELKVDEVEVKYSGCGDEGTIESMQITPDMDVPEELNDDIEDACYSVLNEHHPGWENNDGAAGQIVFNVLEREVAIEHNEYYIESSFSELKIEL
jgi:hypothetical protein